jgi:hypothetical protein
MKKISLLFSFMLAVILLQAQTINLTLKVDMTGKTASADSVHIVGSFNGWNPTATACTDQGNNIWAATFTVKPGDDVEYKFMNGRAWGTEESAPANCTSGNSHNRILTAPLVDLVVAPVLFGECAANTPTKTINFYVDMAGLTVDAAGVHVAGNFNGWSPSFTALTKYNGTVYKASATVLSSIAKLQYKFINGDGWGKEEAPGAPCADAGSKNRLYRIDTITSVGSVPNYKFGTCTSTTTTGLDSKGNSFTFELFPTIASDYIEVKLNSSNVDDVMFNIYSINGSLISSENVARTEASFGKKISVQGLSKGLYLLEVSNKGSKSVQRFMVD